MKNKTDLPKAGAIAIAGIWVMAAAVSVLSASHGSGYDVLDKIADSTSVGVSLEEKIRQDRCFNFRHDILSEKA